MLDEKGRGRFESAYWEVGGLERDGLTGRVPDNDPRRGFLRRPRQVDYFELDSVAIDPPVVVGEHGEPGTGRRPSLGVVHRNVTNSSAFPFPKRVTS